MGSEDRSVQYLVPKMKGHSNPTLRNSKLVQMMHREAFGQELRVKGSIGKEQSCKVHDGTHCRTALIIP